MLSRAPLRATPADYASGAALPIGRTCGDCRNFGYERGTCQKERLAGDETCIYTPNQFAVPGVNGRGPVLRVSLGERLKGRTR